MSDRTIETAKEMKFRVTEDGKITLDGMELRGVTDCSISGSMRDLYQGKAELTLTLIVDAGYKDQAAVLAS